MVWRIALSCAVDSPVGQNPTLLVRIPICKRKFDTTASTRIVRYSTLWLLLSFQPCSAVLEHEHGAVQLSIHHRPQKPTSPHHSKHEQQEPRRQRRERPRRVQHTSVLDLRLLFCSHCRRQPVQPLRITFSRPATTSPLPLQLASHADKRRSAGASGHSHC